ncbi:MAG: hypothetical protein ABWZ40_08885 [Caulobacterales bacterium]
MGLKALTLTTVLLTFTIAANVRADPSMDRMQAMQAAQAQAEAAASRPGDEALTCEQLQTEMTTSMNDPTVQAAIQSNGANAMAMQQQAQNARAGAVGMAGTSMAMGLASSFVPGLGFAQAIAMQAQMGQMKNQTAANQRQMGEMADNMTSIMPQLMRGQRVYNLASAKNCAFLQGPPPGAPTPPN